jgi:5-methyltetrahydrofolate--homocysteine methyltransferase
VYGFFPACSSGDDIVLEAGAAEAAAFHMLRQQTDKGAGTVNYCLADFVAPLATGLTDYVGLFVVTAGQGVHDMAHRLRHAGDDYKAIMVEALADRLAEAFAEWLHARARRDCGFGLDEALSFEDLIRERYRGIRPAPGYPACPDHSEKPVLFRLLDASAHTGVVLTETLAMMPASSICGLYLNHGEARYFPLGMIGRDQLEDYARRRGIAPAEAEKYLRPALAPVEAHSSPQ